MNFQIGRWAADQKVERVMGEAGRMLAGSAAVVNRVSI